MHADPQSEPNRSHPSWVQWPLLNVWQGVSIEDNARMHERAFILKTTPAAVRFWSAEPLLGPIAGVIQEWWPDWVIVGGESGPSSRPMNPSWARSLRDQCAAARVPFFFKQWGDWVSVSEVEGAGPHHQFSDGTTVRRVGKRIAGRTLDGLIHNAMPGAFAPQEEARA